MSVENKFVLPTKKAEVDKKWINQKFGMIGPAGIGKSEFWAQGERTFFIQTEAGLGHLGVMAIPCHSLDDVRKVVGLLFEANSGSEPFPYDTIVVDTVDELIAFVDEDVVARGKDKYVKIAAEIHGIGDVPNGGGWAWRTETVAKIFRKLESLPAAIVYVGHVADKEVKSPTDKWHKNTINFGGQLGGNLTAWPNHLMNLEARMKGEKLVREVRTLPHQTIEAKSHGGWIPNGWVWTDDMKENYGKLRGLFE